MLKVLIVDDERLICEGLRQIVNWDDFGLDSCLLAASAEEALRLMQGGDVGLLITDIKMPGMNGIELIREARRLYPEIKCIVLSGYHEFELVRSAMRAGAMDYLQKPVDAAGLTEALAAVLTEETGAEHETAQTLYLQTMHHIFAGDIQPELQKNRLEYFNFDLNCTVFAVLALRPPGDSVACRMAMDRLQIPGAGLHTVLDGENDLCAILTLQTTNHADTAMERIVRETCRRFSEFAGKAYIGAACICPGGLEQMHAAYCRARTELDCSVMRGIQGLCMPAGGSEAVPSAGDLSPLRRALSDGDKETVSKVADALLHRAEALETTGHRADFHCLYMLNYALSVAACSLVDTSPLPLIKASMMAGFQNAVSTSALRQLLSNALGMIADYINSRWQIRYSPLINRVVQYTLEGYAQKSLCLKVLADELNVNPAYLGRQFKAETGEFYGDFLAHIRIRRAEELLMTSYRNISDIADTVGFSSMATFGRTFRDITFMTPSDIRKWAETVRK